MIELTPDAKVRFEVYLQRMRNALRGSRAVEANEVEQNVREHVEFALSGVAAPVGAERLGAVLEQLGPPERWLPDDDRPIWRRVMSRFMEGPEDWRLAYLSVVVTFLMLVTIPAGGILLLVPAFILSRAWVALMKERGEPLGARKWLILPPIALAFLMFALGLLGSVVGIAGAVAMEQDLRAYGLPHDPQTTEELVRFTGYVVAVAGGWWILLSGIVAFLLEPIRSLFEPLLDRWRRRHLLVLTALGAICLAIGLRLMYIA